jgi:hypothetical protein
MKHRHTAEQSTTNVNKSEMTGKRGFGSIKLAAAGIPLDATPSPVEFAPTPIQSPITVDAPTHTPVPSRGFAAVAATAPAVPEAVAKTEVIAAAPAPTTPVQAVAQTAPVVAASVPTAPMGFSAVKTSMEAPTAAPTAASAPMPVAAAPAAAPVAAKPVFDMPDDGADSPNVCIACQ